ncbi:MAG TPA: hypothetical protein VEV81_01725, partial [Pyrinomonadaceae bacterium]|nr:hypothetical protein [Pyrinomonadaceae bacterium]
MVADNIRRTSARRWLLPLLLLTLSGSARAAAPEGLPRVVIERRRVVIVRTGKLAREFPERKRAILFYPVVQGPKDSEVLQRVRAILDFKNIFDTSLAEYRQDTWLTDFDYKVNYNQNYILDITFTQSGVGAYPDTQTKHFAINLRNGELMKAADAFDSSSLETLAALVDKRLQAEVRQIIKANPKEKGDAQDLFREVKFKTADLDDFSVGARGITFLYDAGFPHVVQALEPVGRYFFSYAQLKPYIK